MSKQILGQGTCTQRSTSSRVWGGGCAADMREKYMLMWFRFRSSPGLIWLLHGAFFLPVTKTCFGTSGRCER